MADSFYGKPTATISVFEPKTGGGTWWRLVQLANKPAPAVRDEAITDAMTDLAVYALLCRILWEEAHGKRI